MKKSALCFSLFAFIFLTGAVMIQPKPEPATEMGIPSNSQAAATPSAPPIELSLYRHPSNAFTIEYPADWQIEILEEGVIFHDSSHTNWIEVDVSNTIQSLSPAEFDTYKKNFDENLESIHESYEVPVYSKIYHSQNTNVIYSLEFGSVSDEGIMEYSLIGEIRSSFDQNARNAQKLKPYPVRFTERGDYAKFSVPISWTFKMTDDINKGMEYTSPDLHGVLRFCTYRYSIEKNLTWQEAYRYAMENLKELFGEDTTIKMLTPHTEGHSTWSWESKSDGERGWAYYRMLWNRLYMITLKYDRGYERLKEVFEESVASLKNHEIYE